MAENADSVLAVPGEIWADAEGTLMCAATGGGWWVFGVADPIPPNAPKIVFPLRLMFTHEGEHVGGSLYRPAHIDGSDDA